jgi:Fur family ferric uptake transcriptional regulator
MLERAMAAPQPHDPTRLVELLAERGVRATPRRLEVLGELAREHHDVTAQQLWERLRRRGVPIGLATVYRSLRALADGGAVDVLNHRDGELCYRLCGQGHHHHLVCTGCHRVVELPDCEVEAWLARVAEEHDFLPTGHQVELAGVCGDCRA